MQDPKVINFRDLGSQPDLVVENILMNLDRKSILAYCNTTGKMKDQCVRLPPKMWKWLIIRDCEYNSKHKYKWTFEEYKKLKCTSTKNNWLFNAGQFGDLELVKTLAKNEAPENILFPLQYAKHKKIVKILKKELENRVNEGDEEAMITLGSYYSEGGEKVKAANMYKKAIKKGNSEAMIKLAEHYVSHTDRIDKFLKYSKMAVKKGDPESMFSLGQYYYENEDNELKKKYYKMGVEKGHLKSMLYLGIHYRIEEGDFKKAKMYYEMAIDKARENGYEYCYAMEELSELYEFDLNDIKNARKYKKMAKKCRKNDIQ